MATKFNFAAVCFGGLSCLSFTSLDAAAEVVSIGASGFEVHESVHSSAPASAAYAALINPSRWWNGEHTFSGSAANLTLDARAGGCWCESLPDGGSVEHLHVVYASPGKVLRLRGALGPFQGMPVDGVMTITVKAATDGSDIVMTYAVGGYSKDGFEALAKAADGVLEEQLTRLKKLLDAQQGKAP
jgi:Polyketide cyclase / dehydrase and lipid transport